MLWKRAIELRVEIVQRKKVVNPLKLFLLYLLLACVLGNVVGSGYIESPMCDEVIELRHS